MSVTTTTLDGLFKERYGDAVEDAVPSGGNDIIASKIRFMEADKLGDSYHEPVRLRRSMGWTFAGGALAGTAFTLNDAVSGQTKDANVGGNEFILRDQIAYGVVSRATSSMEAFGRAFDEVVADMTESSVLARELCLLHGGDDIGTLETVTGAGTSRTWTLTLAGTSAAIWYQFEGAKLDVFDTSGTQRNVNAPVVVSLVEVVDTGADKGKVKITVTGDATDLSACVATDVLVPFGAKGNWMTGIGAVAKNTGTLYGIDASSFGLWKATSMDNGSAVATMATLLHALKKNALKSGMGQRTALCSLATWTDLNNNIAALQRFLDSKQRAGVDLGTSGINVHSNKMQLDIEPHPLMKEGEILILDWRKFKRVGSRDHSWRLPTVNGQEERFFHELPGQAGFELRCYWDQALFCRRPGSITRIFNIKNSV